MSETKDERHARIWREVIQPRKPPEPVDDRPRWRDGDERYETAMIGGVNDPVRVRVTRLRARVVWDVVRQSDHEPIEVTALGDSERNWVPGVCVS